MRLRFDSDPIRFPIPNVRFFPLSRPPINFRHPSLVSARISPYYSMASFPIYETTQEGTLLIGSYYASASGWLVVPTERTELTFPRRITSISSF